MVGLPEPPIANGRERISVVLATYDGAVFLADQLASLCQQERLPDEMVIVDDASNDETPAMLAAFAAKAPFPVDLVLRREHLGTWSTFEEGLCRSTGDIIVICDQDDIWRTPKLRVLGERLAARPDAMMAFSDARLISADGRLIGRSRWRIAGFSPRLARAVDDDAFGPLISRQAVSGCTMAIRSRVLPALLPFPSDIHPGLPVMMYDRWISLVTAAAAPVIPIPEALVDYRIHAGQQIGIPALPVRRFLPQTALHGAQFLNGRAETKRRLDYHVAHLDEIEKRLVVAGMDSAASDARLAEAREHLRFRSALDSHRRHRIRSVAGEMRRADGYRRFSLGMASAIADVAR